MKDSGKKLIHRLFRPHLNSAHEKAFQLRLCKFRHEIKVRHNVSFLVLPEPAPRNGLPERPGFRKSRIL